jgi:hypothetical protein
MTTKSGIRCYGGWTHDYIINEVELPNGRKIERLSKEGADEFVEAVGTDFISTNLTAANEKELTIAYLIMRIVISNASPEKIAAGFPESELRTFAELTLDTLATISTDRNWIQSGKVPDREVLLLEIVANFSKHPSFVKTLFSNEGMKAVAKFHASRKMNDTRNTFVAGLILILVNTALRDLTKEGLTDEKAFGTIEKTGLLGQFIRCVPVDPEYSATIVKRLQRCLQLVKKKLKSGTPTGAILDAVIAGKDGPINEKAKSGLARLQSLARLSNDNGSTFVDIETCQYCGKCETQMDNTKLMKCQRCKMTCYCSKECQVADWKSHKKACKEISSVVKGRSTMKTLELTKGNFIDSNYFDIAKEVYKKTQECNVPKKELLLEIDFYGDAPALRNKFKVWLTSGFLEGSSVADAPDWFRTGRQSEKKAHALILREEYEKVTTNELLVVCRASNGIVTGDRLGFNITNTGHQLLSDEAVESIGREDYDQMVACIGQDMTDEYFREKRSGLE